MVPGVRAGLGTVSLLGEPVTGPPPESQVRTLTQHPDPSTEVLPNSCGHGAGQGLLGAGVGVVSSSHLEDWGAVTGNGIPGPQGAGRQETRRYPQSATEGA